MAEREALQKQYAYHEMSNKVEVASRRGRLRGEPTGEVESLRGHLTDSKMGDRVVSSSAKDEQPVSKKRKVQKEKRKTSEKTPSISITSTKSILDVASIRGYQPTTPSSKAAYQELVTLIGSKEYLSNQDFGILRDAAQVVLDILFDEDLRDPDKQKQLSNVLLYGKSGTKNISGSRYAQMVQWSKAMSDYHMHNKKSNESDEDDMNTEMGVAVVFHSDESDEDNDSDEGEGLLAAIADSESSSSEDDDDEAEGMAEPARAVEDEDDRDEHVGESLGKRNGKKTKDEASSKSSIRSLSVHEIDSHYLQRQLGQALPDEEATKVASLANQVLDILGNVTADLRECENQLLVLLGFDVFPTIQLLLHNRLKLWACITRLRAPPEKRDEVQEVLQKTDEGKLIWKELTEPSNVQDWSRERMRGLTHALKKNNPDKKDDKVSSALDDVAAAGNAIGVKSNSDGDKDANMDVDPKSDSASQKPTELDLEGLAFRDGAHTMSNSTCNLPPKSWRAMKKGYEEVHVPAVVKKTSPGENLIPIKNLPDWTHAAFQGMEVLNPIQSKVCPTALETNENLLLCAPTGGGKTNVAMLTMLNILGRYRKPPNKDDDEDSNNDSDIGKFDKSKFKIVYIAPMKALVQEVVSNFQRRLADYGMVVRELSGDSSLTRQQIAETQLLVTTPEKWDIVTRQGEGRAYTQLVKLVILDEIHLLHDDRGPVLESIVARVIRQVETTAEPIRLVGLSATLPNYADVATFLRVNPKKGLFFFDHSYRPIPLQMQYVGITERNAFKRFQLQNEICYDRALGQRRNDHQMLIFVHSRAETGKTAKALRDMAVTNDDISKFCRDGSMSQEILREESASVKNADLKDVLPYGFAIHHAGMTREDRGLVEDLFADRHVAVLCTTATLAWGVNLPAHAVIIKGTQIYNPSKGEWTELSPLDVLQMLGRAGRPPYDTQGEGIVLTRHSELQYYLSLTNLQLPVESQLIKTLPNHLNAEIVLGTVQSIDEASDWISYTFLYVRMLQNPGLYGITNSDIDTDPTLKLRRRDLAHTAACMLEKSLLAQYDRKSGALRATALGRVASQYYISHTSMAVYSRHMRPNMSGIELLRLFCQSGEFSHITVREEEKLELSKLVGKVPIPVKESPSEPAAKVNILLQAYISRLKLDGFALVADMAFIQQSAARIMRALFEIALRRHWSGLAKLTLDFANMVSHRIWRSQTPLRQFSNVPQIVARKLERKSDIEWSRFADLTPSDLGELVGVPKMGIILHELVHKFPKLDVSAVLQPITRSMLRIELTLVSAFQFDIDSHGYSQLFHVLVEDVNGEAILYHQTFTIQNRNKDDEHVLFLTVPIIDPLPPAYFIRILSDRWLHSESTLPISFQHTILPAKFPPPTELLDLQPLPVAASLQESAFTQLFPFQEFNPIQTQSFHELYKTDRNVLVCAPSGSGKLALANLAVLRAIQTSPKGKYVYITPLKDIADETFKIWRRDYSTLFNNQIVQLTGEVTADLASIAAAKLVIATVPQWDTLTRRWRQRKILQSISLLIFDELHLLGGPQGPTLEIVISRMRYIASTNSGPKSELNKSIRLVGFGASIANAREVGEWMGVPEKSLFNFSPKVRPTPLEIFFQSFEQSNFASRLMAMSKPVYNAVSRHAPHPTQSVIIFVPSHKQAQLTAIDLMTYQESQEQSNYVGLDSTTTNFQEKLEQCKRIRDESLKLVVQAGVGFLYQGMRDADRAIVLDLYEQKFITILVCPAEVCWKLPVRAFLVIVMSTEYYDGTERRHVDYTVGTLLRMMGRASRHNPEGGKCVILCHSPKKEYLKKLLYEPLPVESHLDQYLHDHFNSEIVTRTITNLQDAVDYITWTFLYRRLGKNPNYYAMQGTSNIHISEHLSDMVETVLGDLAESKCCSLDDDGNVAPLNLGMVAAYYYIQYTTIELVASSVTEKTKIRGILEILANASEFSTIPVRNGEEKVLKIEARLMRHKLPDSMQYHEWSTKTLILLQAHFGRRTLSSELLSDQAIILKQSLTVVQAIVDVISSNAWLKPALAAMELSQMIVQGLWNRDSILKQIPHFSDEIIHRCQAYESDEGEKIESIFDILNLDDDVRNELLRLGESQMADVAVFCNNYPSIDVSFELVDADNVVAGEVVSLKVVLERELDADDELTPEEVAGLGNVSSAHYPGIKQEGWWIVVGDTSTNALLSLKRVTLKQKQGLQLEFMAPDEPGDYDLTMFCMSDSYLGCDQEYTINLSVAAGDDDSDDDEEDESSEKES